MKFKEPIDITGYKFNLLTAVSFSHRDKKSNQHWFFVCDCGTTKLLCLDSVNRGLTKSCGCIMQPRDDEYHSRLRKKIKEKSIIINSCWEYQGFLDEDGYAMFNYRGLSKRAHRISYLCFKGKIPSGLLICHTCDNRKCLNPDHLYAGTPKDNMQDAINRGRFPKGPNKFKGHLGEINCKAKLKIDQVKSIRAEYIPFKITAISLSKKYGVSESSIKYILQKKSWKCAL
jgi:hypothetical protein